MHAWLWWLVSQLSKVHHWRNALFLDRGTWYDTGITPLELNQASYAVAVLQMKTFTYTDTVNETWSYKLGLAKPLTPVCLIQFWNTWLLLSPLAWSITTYVHSSFIWLSISRGTIHNLPVPTIIYQRLQDVWSRTYGELVHAIHACLWQHG